MIQTLKTVKEYKESLIAPAIREMLEAQMRRDTPMPDGR